MKTAKATLIALSTSDGLVEINQGSEQESLFGDEFNNECEGMCGV